MIPTEAIEPIVAFSIQEKTEKILGTVRGYVEEDQTYPVPAKYLGRALKDMGLQQNLWVGTGSEEASPRPPRGSDGRVVIAQCGNRSAR